MRTKVGAAVMLLAALNLRAAPANASPAENLRESKSPSTDSPVVYSVAGGRIEIKPRLKYELFLSMHVLQTAEDHHHLFVPWAERMRASLQPGTLQQAARLVQRVHEWRLCSLLSGYDGPDTIQGIAEYLRTDPDGAVRELLRPRSFLGFNNLGVGTARFNAADLAEFVTRYYDEGFGKEWPEHQKLIQEQAAKDARMFETLPFSIPEFMERHTGRTFRGSQKLVFYPSSFSRPQHAYGFSEKGARAVVYKVGGSPTGPALHELLHDLIRGWQKPERMQKVIAELAQEPLFQAEVGRLRGSYGYPEGCLDELVVDAVSDYLSVKAGVISEAAALRRKGNYCPYRSALYDAILDRYDSFPVIDDFVYYALTHIRIGSESGKSQFVYSRDEQPIAGVGNN